MTMTARNWFGHKYLESESDMARNTFRRRVLHGILAVVLGGGMMFGVVPGCDEQVGNTLVLGISQAIISALQVKFTQSVDEPSDSAGGAGVMLDTWKDSSVQRA